MDSQLVDTLRSNWRQLLPKLLEPAKKFVNGEQSYVCPFCSHGAHGDGLTFDPTHPGQLHCFGPCGWSGDIIDLYSKLRQCDFKTAVVELSHLIGLSQEDSQATLHSYSSFIAESQKAFPGSPAAAYLQKRGISTKTAIDGGVGYCQNWRHPKVSSSVPVSPRLIVPTSLESYLARDIRSEDLLTESERRFSKQKVGSVHFYWTEKLQSATEPIFIVEGELDALSLKEIGKNAVALGSVSNVNMFVREMAQGSRPKQPFIVALDNDPAGERAAEILLEALQGQGVVAVDGKSIVGHNKDANEALVKDYNEFKCRVQKVVEKATYEYQHKEPNYNDSFGGLILVSTKEYIENGYARDVENFARFRERHTGFSNLDEKTALYPGLYALGGISSLGKTTFVCQLADQIAGMGEHVLYFPIEQSPMELVSKGISRTMYIKNPETAVSSIQLRSGYLSSSVIDAQKEYAEKTETLCIADCNFNTTVMEIRDAALEYADRTSSAPVIIVDYLQALRSPDIRMIQRESIDLSLRILKDLQTDLSATVIVVSSLNRGNYLVPVGFESFKESGGIEYTCDVVWGIDLLCMDDPLFDTQGHIKTKREIITAAKAAVPREVRLICLKNRYGVSSYSVAFNYLPSYDIFLPKAYAVASKEKCETDSSLDAKLSDQDEISISEAEREALIKLFQ